MTPQERFEQIAVLRRHQEGITAKIEALERGEDPGVTIGVTDHAIERFKERVADLPKSRIIKLANHPIIVDRYQRFGDGDYLVITKDKKGVLCIRDGIVITVLETWMCTVTKNHQSAQC